MDSKAEEGEDAAFVTRVYPLVVVHRAIATRVIDTANATPPAMKKKPIESYLRSGSQYTVDGSSRYFRRSKSRPRGAIQAPCVCITSSRATSCLKGRGIRVSVLERRRWQGPYG